MILSRKLNEAIKIGEGIEVRVIGLRDGQVRLGVTAPKGIRVDREEIRERIDAEKRAAAV